MRPRRAFRPTGDALEARWVLSSLGVHHALHTARHAHVQHVAHQAAAAAVAVQGGAVPTIALVNLFPFPAGTTFVRTVNTGPIATTVVTNTSPAFGAVNTIFAQTGPGFAVVSSLTPSVSTGVTSSGPGGDLNGLVLFGGPLGTPGGDLNGVVLF